MSYHVNPAAYTDVFVFPRDVIRNHIKLAGAAQLKVLLWLFCHGGNCEDVASMSHETGISESDIRDAMQYWIVNGIVADQNMSERESAPEPEPIPDQVQPPKKPKAKPVQKISRFEIAKRSAESAEISWLLTEAQNKFGRTLSNAEMTTLVWLFDSEGLPVEVILMAVEYAASIGKCNIRYIESTALSWINEQIDTVEKAENHLIELERRRQEWHKIATAFGIDRAIPSRREQAFATKWLREWKFSMKMIRLAYDRCVDSTTKLSFGYINKVLESWHSLGVSKPDQIPTEEKKSVKNTKKSTNNKSYDLDEIKQMFSSDDKE